MSAPTLATPTLWLVFSIAVVVMLALDLGVFHRRSHVVSMKEATAWSIAWVVLSLGFNAYLWVQFGEQAAIQFLTGYLIEKALSVDNLFVFLVLFSYFSVPSNLQHRVLFWGVIGALVLRAIFIAAGSAIIHKFHFVLYVFGGILIYTGIKLVFSRGEQVDPEKNRVLRLFKRYVPTVAGLPRASLYRDRERQTICHPPLVGAGYDRSH